MAHLASRPSVYILRCSDGTLYVGHTDEVASREKTHNEGHGARYTAARRPVSVVYSEEHDSIEGAIWRERQLKRWTNEKKEALIAAEREHRQWPPTRHTSRRPERSGRPPHLPHERAQIQDRPRA